MTPSPARLLPLSLFLPCAVAAFLFAPFASAQPAQASPPASTPGAAATTTTAPGDAAVPAPPPPSPVPTGPRDARDSVRGGRGETCRESADCTADLECLNRVCRFADEGKACGARSDCERPLGCFAGSCAMPGEHPIDLGEPYVAPGEPPPPPREQRMTIDGDEMLYVAQWPSTSPESWRSTGSPTLARSFS